MKVVVDMSVCNLHGLFQKLRRGYRVIVQQQHVGATWVLQRRAGTDIAAPGESEILLVEDELELGEISL